MGSHVQSLGARPASPVAGWRHLHAAVRIVVAHPESWDGSGYPYGLAQEAIPLGARIVAVVDAYDAMTSQRPYREAFPDAEWAELVPVMRELCFAALKNKTEEPIGDNRMLAMAERPVTGQDLRKAIYGRWLLTQWAIGAKLALLIHVRLAG